MIDVRLRLLFSVFLLSAICVESFRSKLENVRLKHFWKSTGLSPPEPRNETHMFLLSPDERFNLLFIGSLPYHAITQVRIHWLLTLITYNQQENTYNFTYLDRLLDFMHDVNLAPGFELMGVPLNVKPAQIKSNIFQFWFELTESIAKRYIKQFGYNQVQKWRFETMNEPDLKQYNFLNFTLPEYLQYFEACTSALHNVSISYVPVSRRRRAEKVGNLRPAAAAVQENVLTASDTVAHDQRPDGDKSVAVVSKNAPINNAPVASTRRRNHPNNHVIAVSSRRTPRKHAVVDDDDDRGVALATRIRGGLRMGAPAGLFKQRDRHPLCWGALDLCSKRACYLHFVSFHRKGEGSAATVLSEDLVLLDALQHYAFVKTMPIANDEADILTNWSLDEEWRADVRYAALVTKVIVDHFKEVILRRRVAIEVLSNDNAFLNYHPHYFTQRTLLARFQINNTSPPHVQFISKPVHVTMGLLSLLGNRYSPHVNDQIAQAINATDVHFLCATRSSNYANVFTILVLTLNDTTVARNISFPLSIIDETNATVAMTIYSLDNVRTNPYQVWKHSGSPVYPDRSLRRRMRASEGPVIEEVKLEAKVRLLLKIPSIHVINICVNMLKNTIPKKVINLRGYFVTQKEVLLTWSDKKVKSRCIKTYEVEYQPSANETFRRINAKDTIFLSYQHDDSNYAADNGASIQYRVRAVDYWNRPGPYSNIINNNHIITF